MTVGIRLTNHELRTLCLGRPADLLARRLGVNLLLTTTADISRSGRYITTDR